VLGKEAAVNKLSSSTQYVFIPVTGPAGLDLTTTAASIALLAEATGGEPADGDYKTAIWSAGEAVLLISKGDYPDGQYLAFVRVVHAPEDVRLFSGRIRIGDVRA
jgi:hypothetical protein